MSADILAGRRTIGEVYGPAMEMSDQAEADRYFAALVERHLERSPGDTRGRAEEVQRANLGYYAGYYDAATRERVERLFRCAHPVFGSIAAVGVATADQAMQLGHDIMAGTKRTG